MAKVANNAGGLVNTHSAGSLFLGPGLIEASLGPRPKPTPARIASSTTSDTRCDPCWGGFRSGAETTLRHVLLEFLDLLQLFL